MDKQQRAIVAGWVYSKEPHEKLDLKYAARKTENGMEIMFEDKVRYKEKEVSILLEKGGTTKNIHMIKKIFRGEIVK